MPTKYSAWRHDSATKGDIYEDGDLTALAEIVPNLIEHDESDSHSHSLKKKSEEKEDCGLRQDRNDDEVKQNDEHKHYQEEEKNSSKADDETADIQWVPIDPMESMITNKNDLKFVCNTRDGEDDGTPGGTNDNDGTQQEAILSPPDTEEKQQELIDEYNQIKEKCLDIKKNPDNQSSESSVTTMRGDNDEGDIMPPLSSDMDNIPKPPLPHDDPSLRTCSQSSNIASPSRIPLHLPDFKPATGCTNASDFIVRCFVARLRSGITVVKHGRSRWCKSRLRTLVVLSDSQTLSWKPAVGEPPSSKRPPKLDLSTCTEVRHAWSSDPLSPMFTGTLILRQKCIAGNAHKSFALIFPKRTVDITAITADQCKVLMEGFSALCYRLQSAKLEGSKQRGKQDEDEHTTASATLTNNSTTQVSVSIAASPSGTKKDACTE